MVLQRIVNSKTQVFQSQETIKIIDVFFPVYQQRKIISKKLSYVGLAVFKGF